MANSCGEFVVSSIDPARNMHRFYRLDVQPDLFGGVLLVKEWGRIGAQARMVAEFLIENGAQLIDCGGRTGSRRICDGTPSH